MLRALQYLPNVVQLQRVLTSCFSHKLDCDEASGLSIAGALEYIAKSGEYIFHFFNIILQNYIGHTCSISMHVVDDFCHTHNIPTCIQMKNVLHLSAA